MTTELIELSKFEEVLYVNLLVTKISVMCEAIGKYGKPLARHTIEFDTGFNGQPYANGNKSQAVADCIATTLDKLLERLL